MIIERAPRTSGRCHTPCSRDKPHHPCRPYDEPLETRCFSEDRISKSWTNSYIVVPGERAEFNSVQALKTLKKLFQFPDTQGNALMPISLGLAAIEVIHEGFHVADDGCIFGFF